MSGEAVVKFSDIITSRSCDYLCKCKLNLSENLIGIYCLSVISNPVSELNLCQTGYVSQVYNKTHHFVNEYTYSASCFLYNENNMLTKLNLYKTNCSGNGILMLAECIRMCNALEDFSCRKCSLTSSDIIELLSHCESNGISHKSLSSWDLRDNFIDNMGVVALIKSIPDIFPHLENVSVDGNLVSDEVKEKLKNLLKRLESVEEESAESSSTASDDSTPYPSHSSCGMDQQQTSLSVCESETAIVEKLDQNSTCTTDSTVQSPHRMDQEETKSDEETAEVTTLPQTTPPSLHGSISGVCALETVAVEELSACIDESTVQSPHRTDQPEMIGGKKTADVNAPLQTTPPSLNDSVSVSGDGAVGVTTPPQTTPLLQEALSEVCESTTANIEEPRLYFSCTNESTVQSPHRVDQEETTSVDGVTDVTTPPQSTPSLQDNLLGVCESETATVEEQKLDTTCTATNESTVQSLQRMDDTSKSDGRTDVTTPPQTIPSPHDILSGGCRLKTITIEELKARTEVTDTQLDSPIKEKDIIKLSSYFDNVENYLVHLELNPSQQTDIKNLVHTRGTQIAMSEALKLWRERNPFAATYRALVEVLLDLEKGRVAVDVCSYLSSKPPSHKIQETSTSAM